MFTTQKANPCSPWTPFSENILTTLTLIHQNYITNQETAENMRNEQKLISNEQ